MIIGSFTYNLEADTYFGEIRTLSLHRSGVTIKPSGRTGERDPDYQITLPSENGEVELGAGWRKRSERGNEYLSIVIDDPALPKRCDAALFTDDANQTARLVWTRPPIRQPEPAQQPSQQPARPARARRSVRRTEPEPIA